MLSGSPAYLKTNLLSGLTVALALVPQASAFALVAHVSPLTGLYAAVLVSFITSAFGGRPGMISGAAGALAVVMVALVVEHGVQYLGIESKTVGGLGEIGGGLPQFALPDLPFNLETLKIVFPYALVLAGVGLIESLLTLTLVDEITETPSARYRAPTRWWWCWWRQSRRYSTCRWR